MHERFSIIGGHVMMCPGCPLKSTPMLYCTMSAFPETLFTPATPDVALHRKSTGSHCLVTIRLNSNSLLCLYHGVVLWSTCRL